ncbi:MAG: hypothetical protein HY392_02280 [Candidatus Diapherotrites archaeon]|nr:hypothetical protein [Candidatus Diapherotrites archaeon]
MPGRPIKNLAYLIKFRKGETNAFMEFVQAKKELIQWHSRRLNVPERLIIEELFHRFKTVSEPRSATEISNAAKMVAKRHGKPRGKPRHPLGEER